MNMKTLRPGLFVRAVAFAAALFLCETLMMPGAVPKLEAYAASDTQQAGWQEDAGGRWYRRADGSFCRNGWEYIDGNMYFFDVRGYVVRNGFVADGGHMYIVDSEGRMLKSTQLNFNGSEYVIDENGYATTAAIYYESLGMDQGSSQSTQTGQSQQTSQGWKEDGIGKWYVRPDGNYPVSTWENINEQWYYFDEQGYMVKDRIMTFTDGSLRYLGSDGKWVTSTEVSYDGVDYTVDAAGVATAKEPPKSANELAAESYAANIVSQITNASMSKPEKANAIYNWLRGHITYTSSGPQSDEAYSALYGFRRRSGCCYEYYAMAHYMLEAAGMPNIPVVRATDHGHYWNLVNVDGVWYHFDATPRRTGGRWCLVTTAYLRSHSWSSHNFDVAAYPATP